jgi:hypothetical protein
LPGHGDLLEAGLIHAIAAVPGPCALTELALILS